MNETLKLVFEECFWNDYKINITEAEKLLNNKDKEFTDYLIMRILSDSKFPSARLKALFSIEYLKDFLYNISPQSSFITKRIMLVRSVLFRDPEEGYRPWSIN